MAQTQYGEQNYWEARFRRHSFYFCFCDRRAECLSATAQFLLCSAAVHSEEEFEWYHPWAPILKEALEKHGLASSQKVLVVGCGNSGNKNDAVGLRNIFLAAVSTLSTSLRDVRMHAELLSFRRDEPRNE